MPACKICKNRIDLSITGIRAHKCKDCNRLVCRNHYDFGKGICYECAGLPIVEGKISFSFIRKSSEISSDKSRKG